MFSQRKRTVKTATNHVIWEKIHNNESLILIENEKKGLQTHIKFVLRLCCVNKSNKTFKIETINVDERVEEFL